MSRERRGGIDKLLEPEHEWTDEERQALVDRLDAEAEERRQQKLAPLRMEAREKRTAEVLAIARHMLSLASRLQKRNVHLADVSTCPADFMQAKQLFMDVVNRLLQELSAVGVDVGALDGAHDARRQMKLFDAGAR